MRKINHLLHLSKDKILFTLIFLATMNFIGRFFYWYVLAFFCIFLLKSNMKIYIPKGSFLLIVIGFSMLLFSVYDFSITNIIKPFVYFFTYVIGANIFNKFKSIRRDEHIFERLVLVIVFGAFTHLILNMIYNIGNTFVYRNTFDFWSKEELSATAQASFGAPAIAISMALLFSKVDMKKKIMACILLIITLVYNLTLAGRTLILITAVVVILGLIIRIINSRNRISIIIKMIRNIIFILLIAYFVYNYNIFGFKDYIASSSLYNRFFGEAPAMELNQDARMEYKILYIKYFSESIFGGSKLYTFTQHYAHDLLLDAYDSSGIFTLISLIILLIGSVIKCFKVLFLKQISQEFKFIVIFLYGTFFIIFCLEPIFAGYQWLFASYCMVDAALVILLKRKNRSYSYGAEK